MGGETRGRGGGEKKWWDWNQSGGGLEEKKRCNQKRKWGKYGLSSTLQKVGL